MTDRSKFAQLEKCGFPGFLYSAIPTFWKVKDELTRSADSSYRYTYSFGEQEVCNDPVQEQTDPIPGGPIDPPCAFVEADETTDTHQGTHTAAPCPNADEQIFSTDLSEPDTTAALIGRVGTLLSETDWTSPAIEAAQYHLSPDQTICNKGVYQFKLDFAPSPTCFQKAWYRITEIPEVGPPVTGSWIECFSQIDSGFPCFGGCANASDECNSTGWITISPPSTNGGRIVDVVVSCDPAFTPT